ncbi:unnamed protein product [Sphenostylis stenocarpa]|uniref:Uncharacterized protein n=1 Tax=Sphenostylis stenocarpa TaxID=92480 RepID=A0AA86T121_9FABA|nr:unnamed protein product [Sphenostylis stenocarpa]
MAETLRTVVAAIGNVASVSVSLCHQRLPSKGINKEQKHRRIFMHSLHHSTDELSPFHLVKVAMIAVPVGILFCIIAIVSSFSFHDHRHRKLLVGSIPLGISIAMYSSPLVAMVSHLSLPPHRNFSL